MLGALRVSVKLKGVPAIQTTPDSGAPRRRRRRCLRVADATRCVHASVSDPCTRASQLTWQLACRCRQYPACSVDEQRMGRRGAGGCPGKGHTWMGTVRTQLPARAGKMGSSDALKCLEYGKARSRTCCCWEVPRAPARTRAQTEGPSCWGWVPGLRMCSGARMRGRGAAGLGGSGCGQQARWHGCGRRQAGDGGMPAGGANRGSRRLSRPGRAYEGASGAANRRQMWTSLRCTAARGTGVCTLLVRPGTWAAAIPWQGC